MLKKAGDWVSLGAADEQKPAQEPTLEAWGRSPDNRLGGWYGLKKGLRGRFGVYVPPLMEALGLCELEHNPKNNRMRAIWQGVGLLQSDATPLAHYPAEQPALFGRRQARFASRPMHTCRVIARRSRTA